MKMRRALLWAAAVAAAAMLVAFGYWLASLRAPAAADGVKPGAQPALGDGVVAVVNGRQLLRRELVLRGQTLLQDAKRTEHLTYAKEREAEALAHYMKQALRTWIAKEVMLYGALAAGVKPSLQDEQKSFEQIRRVLEKRGMTPEQFFREGPLDEETKRRDFFDAVLVAKFIETEIQAKITLTEQEIAARTKELKDLNVKTTKPGNKPRFHTDRRSVEEMLRVEHQTVAMRQKFRELFPKAAVKCPQHPEFETADGVSPESK